MSHRPPPRMPRARCLAPVAGNRGSVPARRWPRFLGMLSWDVFPSAGFLYKLQLRAIPTLGQSMALLGETVGAPLGCPGVLRKRNEPAFLLSSVRFCVREALAALHLIRPGCWFLVFFFVGVAQPGLMLSQRQRTTPSIARNQTAPGDPCPPFDADWFFALDRGW